VTLFRRLISVAFLVTLSVPALGSSMAVDRSRVIYLEGQAGSSLTLANTGEASTLVQLWVDRGEGDPDSVAPPFVVIPSVLHMPAGSRRAVRVMFTEDDVPRDRESLYWINIYQISERAVSSSPGQKDGSTLDLALNMQLKLFFRPAQIPDIPLPLSPSNIQANVNSKDLQSSIHIKNQSPHFISMVAIDGGEADTSLRWGKNEDLTLPPFSSRTYQIAPTTLQRALGSKLSDTVRISYIDDSGYTSQVSLPIDND